MKIKTEKADAAYVMSLPGIKHDKPVKQKAFFRALVNAVSKKELSEVGFTYDAKGFEDVGDEPCLVLMNHSCFLDLKMAFKMMAKRPFNIICTSDGFVGKKKLMYSLGCVPTEKFVSDYSLVRDMKYVLNELHSSVLMYPEASYSFDGTATPLPDSVGSLIKLLKVPVVVVLTKGAFLHDPLYNGLRLRKVSVSAKTELAFTKQDAQTMTAEQINEKLKELFSFDNFAYQKEAGITVNEPFRAEGLERVLYKCACCGAEGKMKGSGEDITCGACGKTYRLREDGQLEAKDGVTEYPHIPDWFRWQRRDVREQIEDGKYRLDMKVGIRVMTDMKAVYEVGDGRLIHDENGFILHSDDGVISYSQSPVAAYSVYADYFWYELGDMICIGDKKKLFYCFPKDQSVPVAKIRLAAEEMFKLKKKK